MKNTELKISSCKDAGCGFKCCHFQQGNYIVLLPNELDNVELSTNHLEVIDEDYHGGKKVVCTAKDTSSCDNGYKPIDCGLYPIFPKGDNGYIVGSKCPLHRDTLSTHKEKCEEVLKEYKEKHTDIDLDNFLKKVEMVGYEDL